MPVLLAVASLPFSAQAETRYAALVPKLSSTLPKEVLTPPSPGKAAIDDQPFFDYFAWQTMIALCWPANTKAGAGEPAGPNEAQTFLTANTGKGPHAPVVWSTYGVTDDLFHSDGSAPVPWKALHAAPPVRTLSKFQKLPTDGSSFLSGISTDTGLFNQAFGGPLIDQNGHYTMYDEYYNETEYSYIRERKFYLRKELNQALVDVLAKNRGKTGLALPDASTELKASWRQMVDGDDLSRYFVVEARIPGSNGSATTTVRMGLVGLHIAVKTKAQPQWLWATFEQVDNVVARTPDAKASYNSGHSSNPQGFSYEPAVLTTLPPPAHPLPVEVNRVVPIQSARPAGYATADFNAQYQKLLKGTVWENYELITCQWPTAPSASTVYNPMFNPKNYKPADAGTPEPPFVANTTMETYFQGSDPDVQKPNNNSNSCMQCHLHAATYGMDYSWSLYNHAFPSPPPGLDPVVPAKPVGK